MINRIEFERWKSFGRARLDIEPLTTLIGPNASGKSNALDALEFLRRTALGSDIQTSLIGDQNLSPIRGGLEWAALKDGNYFMLVVFIQGGDDKTEYYYSITVQVTPKVEIDGELLIRSRGSHNITLFDAYMPPPGTPGIIARLYNGRGGTRKEVRRSASVLSQLVGLSLNKEVADGVEKVSKALRSVFILDPIPSNMRIYSPLSENLQTSASNVAGVLAALPTERKLEVETILTTYLSHLPEQDIRRVWAEPVGRFQTDAMLYCEEQWSPSVEPMIVDARGMSDGTLRFLAILTALLTRPEGSLLVIEEVDNGLHPSRAGLLLQMLRQIGAERKIDVLVTTHNPALLDALGPEMIPFVVVAHRDSETGESKLTLLEDLQNLPKLMASGPLGEVVTEGLLEKSLSGAR